MGRRFDCTEIRPDPEVLDWCIACAIVTASKKRLHLPQPARWGHSLGKEALANRFVNDIDEKSGFCAHRKAP